MVLITLLLTAADAKPSAYTSCSTRTGSSISSTFACQCERASSKGSLWFDAITDGVALGLSPVERTYGTCFDNNETDWSMAMESWAAQSALRRVLEVKGMGRAKTESATWILGSPWRDPGVIVVEEGPVTISDLPEGEEDWQPLPDGWGSYPFELMQPYAMVFDPHGHPFAEIFTESRVIIDVTALDLNDDQQIDIVINFEDGDSWQTFGPFDQGDLIFPPEQ